MGLFNACDQYHTFCMMCADVCRQKVPAPEVFDFLKKIGVTPENIGAYVEAFKKWIALDVRLTPLHVLYLAEKNHLVSLPFFDPKLIHFAVGIEIEGTCFFEHYQRKGSAPLMSLKQAHSFLEQRTSELLKFEGATSPRMLTFPTTADLAKWSDQDPYISQTLHIYSRKFLANIRCENGVYWIDPTLKKSLAKVCAKLYFDKIETYAPQSEETFCRAMAVAHLDPKYDFRGEFAEFGELTPETLKELTHLRRLSEII